MQGTEATARNERRNLRVWTQMELQPRASGSAYDLGLSSIAPRLEFPVEV